MSSSNRWLAYRAHMLNVVGEREEREEAPMGSTNGSL